MRHNSRVSSTGPAKPLAIHAKRVQASMNTVPAPSPTPLHSASTYRVQAAVRASCNMTSRTSYEPNATGAGGEDKKQGSENTDYTSTVNSNKNSKSKPTIITNKIGRVRLPGAISRSVSRNKTDASNTTNGQYEKEWPSLEEVRRNSDPTGRGFEEVSINGIFKKGTRIIEPRKVPKILSKNSDGEHNIQSYRDIARQGDCEEKLIESWKERDRKLRVIEKELQQCNSGAQHPSSKDSNYANSNTAVRSKDSNTTTDAAVIHANIRPGGVSSKTTSAAFCNSKSTSNFTNSNTGLIAGFVDVPPSRRIKGNTAIDDSKVRKQLTLTEQFELSLRENRYNNLQSDDAELVTPATIDNVSYNTGALIMSPCPGSQELGAQEPTGGPINNIISSDNYLVGSNTTTGAPGGPIKLRNLMPGASALFEGTPQKSGLQKQPQTAVYYPMTNTVQSTLHNTSTNDPKEEELVTVQRSDWELYQSWRKSQLYQQGPSNNNEKIQTPVISGGEHPCNQCGRSPCICCPRCGNLWSCSCPYPVASNSTIETTNQLEWNNHYEAGAWPAAPTVNYTSANAGATSNLAKSCGNTNQTKANNSNKNRGPITPPGATPEKQSKSEEKARAARNKEYIYYTFPFGPPPKGFPAAPEKK